jgi:retron-type reverse transcriptase
MGFWDKVKGFFGMGDGTPPPLARHDPALVTAVEAAVAARCAQGSSFEAVDIADTVTASNPSRGVAEIRAACRVVEALFDAGRFGPLGYTRTGLIYHPVGKSPDAFVPPRGGSSFPPPAQPSARPLAPAPRRVPPAPVKDPLQAGDILGLSPDELRKRALKIKPFETAWIGRVDTIPPQSDERTALIDRGLVLRGFLTPEQIAEIHRIGDRWLLHHEAAKLAEIAAQQSVEAFLQAQRAEKARIKEQKKKESTERRAQRAAAIAKRREEDIVYLGRGVSGGLADRRTLVEELSRRGLPLLATPGDLARALGIRVSRLRWLAFHADAAHRTHYVYFEVPKRTGGTRLLSAPHQEMKRAQRWILDEILSKLPVTESAHGFVTGRSTVSNAQAHVARDVVVNCDLKDFFPSITWKRVRGVFRAIGYSSAVATVLALLCTESPRTRVEHDGKTYWVAVGERCLPQGAPTSPALSNQIARKLDQRLRGLCKKMGWAYTRYADDLTFSAGEGHREQIGLLLARIRHVVEDEGFRMNPKKCRVQRAARRQEVTGIIVNDKLSLPREEIRTLRAMLHNAKKAGLAGQNRDAVPNFDAYVRGKIAYISMVDRAKGDKLLAAFNALSKSGEIPPDG